MGSKLNINFVFVIFEFKNSKLITIVSVDDIIRLQYFLRKKITSQGRSLLVSKSFQRYRRKLRTVFDKTIEAEAFGTLFENIGEASAKACKK